MSSIALPLVLTTRQAAEYLSLAETTLEKKRGYGDGPLFIRLSACKTWPPLRKRNHRKALQ
jgi:hypothetical protein